MTDTLQGSPPPSTPPGDLLPPLLRGWLHLVCFVLSVPAGLLVVAGAGSGRARLAGVVYAIGMTAMFGVSATYHGARGLPPGAGGYGGWTTAPSS